MKVVTTPLNRILWALIYLDIIGINVLEGICQIHFILPSQVQQNLGYCPQFDALIDQMTGEETLYMYARLRGIENSQIPGVVNSLIETMMLKKHAEKQAGVYR